MNAEFDVPPYGKAVEPPASPLAIVSVVTGALSYVCLPLIGGIAAIITGHMARGQIRASRGQLGGSTVATVGLVLGYIHMALILVGILVFSIMIAIAATSLQVDASRPGKIELRSSIGAPSKAADTHVHLGPSGIVVQEEGGETVQIDGDGIRIQPAPGVTVPPETEVPPPPAADLQPEPDAHSPSR